MHEYNLKAGLLSTPEKLIISPANIQYGSQVVTKDSFKDVRYLAESIIWYEFRVGFRYRIQVKYQNDKVLSIPFSRYFGMNKEYRDYYTKISSHIGEYFLSDKIYDVIDQFQATGRLESPGLIITMDYIQFENPDQFIKWENLGLKEYYNYFGIFDKSKPEVNRRVTFDEWNAEILFNVLKRLSENLESN
jgi:hypothetical protein